LPVNSGLHLPTPQIFIAMSLNVPEIFNFK
jgi:hypothetical protein